MGRRRRKKRRKEGRGRGGSRLEKRESLGEEKGALHF